MRNRDVRMPFGVPGLLATASAAAMAAAMLAAPANALVPNDDLGVDGAVDTDNVWAGVGQMFSFNQDTGGFGLCTGQLINPRAVIFAAHCVDTIPDEAYGAQSGGRPISFGFLVENEFTLSGQIGNWLNSGFQTQPDDLLFNVHQVQTIFAGSEFFPGGDVALATFDTHIDNLPTYGMLFSPLEGPTRAAMVGYGGTGSGSTGDDLGIDFKRRAGENMIDGLFSQNDYLGAAFNVAPGFGFGTADAAQLLYHIDFDNPNRIDGDCARDLDGSLICNTPPFSDSVFTLDGTTIVLPSQQIDWYPGAALPGESGTAGGDSGGALFIEDMAPVPLVAGVLSGGWVEGLAAPIGNGYGDVSYYNPLFLFRDWIQTNNPYVYASARHGSRNWSNPNHWIQDMDPNYYYIDEHGVVRNGVPSDPEPGYFADTPKWGTVFDLSIPDQYEGDTGPDALLGDLGAPAGAAADLSADATASVSLPEHWNYGGWHGGGSSPSSPAASDGEPTGPGSTGFVPNNDFGTFGSWTAPTDGVARYYDVTLDNIGTTRLDMNVEIDRLTIEGALSRLRVREGYQLNSLIAVDQHRGFVDVDGVVETREYMLWGGALTGEGAINAQTLFNVDGLISAGSLFRVGEFTINGDYVQTSRGDMLVNIQRRGRHVYNDFIQVNGDASLDGDVIVAPVNFRSRPRWRDEYTILNADNVVGDFDDVDLLFASFLLYGESVIQPDGDVDIVVRARRFSDLFGRGHRYRSLGRALDGLRWNGFYNDLEDVFDLVDSASFETIEGSLFSLTPHGAFNQTSSIISFNNSFASHLANRGAELRAGVRGLSANGVRGAFASRERAGYAMPNMAGFRSEAPTAAPVQLGDRFGMFISSRGSFDDEEMGAQTGFEYDPMARIVESQGDLAIGADYRLTDNLAVGMALTTSRMDFSSNGVTPLSNESVGAAGYATAFGSSWYLDGYYGFAQQDFEMERVTPGLIGNPSLAYGAPEGEQSMAGLRAGWTLAPAEGFRFGPTASLNYTQMRLGSYQEFAAGDFNLIVDERDLTSMTVEAGAEFRFAHQTNRGHLISAFGEISAVRELGDTTDLVTAAFSAAPDQRFTFEQLLDDEWFSVSAGFGYALSSNLSARFELNSDFDRGALDNHYGTVGFNWRF